MRHHHHGVSGASPWLTSKLVVVVVVENDVDKLVLLRVRTPFYTPNHRDPWACFASLLFPKVSF